MPVKFVTDDELRTFVALLQAHGDVKTASAASGINRNTIAARLVLIRRRFPDALPSTSVRPGWARETPARSTGSPTVGGGSHTTAPHSESRRAALRGEIGGPPIPEIARPPVGFVVTRNGGEYDADGSLLRQWVGTQRDSGEVYDIPAGHVVKGESALLDPDGRILAKWVKTREGAGEGLIEALKATFAEYDGLAPAIPPPVEADDDLLTIYPVPDLHFGMLAWGEETGADYDIKIATGLVTSGIETLVAQSRPSRRACLLVLGDYFHANDTKSVTPGSGHNLDVDGRWAKVFAAGAHLAVAMVGILARKHQEVEAVFLRGNHDVDAAMCLMVALSLFYSGNERITVNQDPGIAWYRRFGSCLLGATHGHTMRPDAMAMMMAVDRAEDWGQSKHRNFFFAHIHTETAKEVAGVRVESFSSPAARDAWNAAAGYRSGRALSALTFHVEHGEIGRHRVNIPGGRVGRAA